MNDADKRDLKRKLLLLKEDLKGLKDSWSAGYRQGVMDSIRVLQKYESSAPESKATP